MNAHRSNRTAPLIGIIVTPLLLMTGCTTWLERAPGTPESAPNCCGYEVKLDAERCRSLTMLHLDSNSVTSALFGFWAHPDSSPILTNT